jgi:SAM-dependent methyltransferase
MEGVDRNPASVWDQVASRAHPSWYLDPLVAKQKQDLHIKLFQGWMPASASRALKTDVFEEAFGADALLGRLAPLGQTWIGMDVAAETVRQARARSEFRCAHFLAGDVRHVPLRSESLDAIVSNSTLDHFAEKRDFETAIAELARLLGPGGRLLITVDNPRNPLFWPLRWLSRLRQSPFALGYTPSATVLRQTLQRAGLLVTDTRTLIHNPRGVSTVLFLALRRIAGTRADPLIQWLLGAFAKLERLPTRGFTACFLAACAVRPLASPPQPAFPNRPAAPCGADRSSG